MLGIHGFLKKYLDFTPPERSQARAVLQALKECLDIEVTEDAVAVRNGKAFVSTDTIQKSEIVLNKTRLLKKTAHILGSGAVLDIV